MEKTREHWSSRVGFILAAIGSTVGLGLLWKFPYTIGQNGGGLFLILYFACLFLIGIPLFVGEIVLGRHAKAAALGAFAKGAGNGSSWLLGGWLGIMASFVIMSFYSVIAGWGMSYILMSLGGFYEGKPLSEIALVYEKLSHSGSITLLWHFLFTAITVSIVMSGVKQGIEYWSKIMVRILLVLLFGLFLYSVTLPGFKDAAHFIFYPELSKFSVTSVLEALGLALMTMSLGQGIMISYGSYLRAGDNVLKMSIIVACSVVIVAILAALTIFPVVFSFDLPPNSGSGLVFQTLPFLFAQLPGSLILSTLFFTLFVFTALTSAIPLIEVCATNMMEKFQIDRRKAVIITGLSTFVFGIPSALAGSKDLFPQWQTIFRFNFLETMNELSSVWLIPLAGLWTSLFLGWVMDKNVLAYEFRAGSKHAQLLFPVWHLFLRYLIPVIIVLIMVQKSGLLGGV